MITPLVGNSGHDDLVNQIVEHCRQFINDGVPIVFSLHSEDGVLYTIKATTGNCFSRYSFYIYDVRHHLSDSQSLFLYSRFVFWNLIKHLIVKKEYL